MNRSTAAALNRINLEFYDQHGEEFSVTRRRPWPGWGRVIGHLERRLQQGGRQTASILDLGCGNGRLASLLAKRSPSVAAYCGVDASRSLLAAARSLRRRSRKCRERFLCADLVSRGLSTIARASPFDLVALFGMLHHVPGFERRRELLLEAAELLRPGGILALTFWQFGAYRRFQTRVIEWEDHNRRAAEKIPREELEPGDLLLAWGETGSGGGPTPRRYCHFADRREAKRLVDTLGLSVIDSFTADGEDGALNLYFLLESSE